MEIHESHQTGTTEIDGKEYPHCKVCGSVTNVLVMEAPCMGEAPALQVIDDSDVIAIQWSFPEGGIKSSDFPQPLVTVDYALDNRPIQLVLVGPRALELRKALGEPRESREEASYKAALERIVFVHSDAPEVSAEALAKIAGEALDGG